MKHQESLNYKLILCDDAQVHSDANIKEKWINRIDNLNWNEVISKEQSERKADVNGTVRYAVFLKKNPSEICCEILRFKHQNNNEKKIVFLFPGVGDHYSDMVRSLYHSFPIYKSVIDEYFFLLKEKYGLDVLWVLDNNLNDSCALHKEGDDKATDNNATDNNAGRSEILRDIRHRMLINVCSSNKNEERLKQTDVAHPFVFIHEYALAKQLIGWGVCPDIVVGYSLGEYTAAVVAGGLSVENTLTWVAMRSRLVNQLSRKSMLAVAASYQACENFVGGQVKPVAFNSPNNLILAGDEIEVEKLRMSLKEKAISAMPVKLNHAFHTPFMHGVLESLVPYQGLLHSEPVTVTLLTTTDTQWYLPGSRINTEYWKNQLVSPVDFISAGKKLSALNRYYIEVGGGSALTTILKQQEGYGREDWERMIVLEDRRNNSRDGTLHFLKAMAKLWSDGLIEANNIPNE